MRILNNMLKGQFIWQNHLWDIQVQKGCVFLRHPVCYGKKVGTRKSGRQNLCGNVSLITPWRKCETVGRSPQKDDLVSKIKKWLILEISWVEIVVFEIFIKVYYWKCIEILNFPLLILIFVCTMHILDISYIGGKIFHFIYIYQKIFRPFF